MENVVQAFKVLRNLMHAETNARCPKTGFTSAFSNTFPTLKKFSARCARRRLNVNNLY